MNNTNNRKFPIISSSRLNYNDDIKEKVEIANEQVEKFINTGISKCKKTRKCIKKEERVNSDDYFVKSLLKSTGKSKIKYRIDK